MTVRTRAWFWPEHAPTSRVKARVFWSANPGTELLSDAMVETYVGPKDTLDARAVIGGDGGISASVHVYLSYAVRGVPLKDVRPMWTRDPAAWDHWVYAGGGCGDFVPNPLNPRELLSQDELDPIRRDVARAFKDRLAGARVGTVAASEEAQAVIDGLLPMVDEPTRRQLGLVCDHLGGKTKTSPRDAALFVGEQVSVWARGREYAWMGGSEAAERGEASKREPDDPMFSMYKPLFDVEEGGSRGMRRKRGWVH